MNEDWLDHLSIKILDDRVSLTEQLARGLVKDYPEYVHVVGRISALDSIHDAIKDIQTEMEKE